MITLNFSQTPDFDIIGEYQTYKNSLIIGHSERADLPINDQTINDIHCILKLSEASLLIRSIPDQSFYYLNGKKFSGEHLLKPNDQIKIGSTIFNISNFLYNPKSTPSDFKEAYKKTIQQYPETGILLEVLEREISNLLETDDKTRGI